MFKRKGKIVVCATVFVFMLCSSLFAGGVQDSFEDLNNSVNELMGGSGSKKEEPKTNSQNTSSQNKETAPVEKAEPAKPAEPVLVVKEMVLPTEPNSEDDFDVTITEDGQGARVTGYKGKSGGVYIPATIQGLPVKEVYFKITATEPTYVNALVVSEGCEKIIIGNENLSNTSYNVSYHVYENRDYATYKGYSYDKEKNCYQLYVDKKVVEEINPKGFELGLISLPDSIVEFRLYRTAITEFEVPANVKTVSILPVTLEKVSFRGVPESIAKDAFHGTQLSHIELPEGLKRIETNAFEKCKLKSISLPSSLTHIGEEAFYSTSLEAITIPGSVEVLEDDVFRECDNLKTVVISDGVKEIRSTFDSLESLESVTLPSTLEKLHGYSGYTPGSFSRCNNLKELIIPENLTKLQFYEPKYYYRGEKYFEEEDDSAFSGCSKLPLGTQARLKKLGYTGRF